MLLLPHHTRSSSTKKRRRRRRPSSSSSSSDNNKNKGILIAIIFGLCLVNILDVDIGIHFSRHGSSRGGRRSLLSSLYLSGPSTLLPWAEHHLVGVMDRPDVKAETALFWRKFVHNDPPCSIDYLVAPSNKLTIIPLPLFLYNNNRHS